MKLLDKKGTATATVISQSKLDKTDTVYNFEVQEFSTYHIGELGVWVHNANCCDLTPGTPEHKAWRWKESQDNPLTAGWDYDRWSRTYDVNVNQARRANEAVSNYHNQLGWGRTEISVEVEVNGAVFTRRLDIADPSPDVRRGIEHKTGYQAASDDILWEVDRDAQLIKRG